MSYRPITDFCSASIAKTYTLKIGFSVTGSGYSHFSKPRCAFASLLIFVS